MACQIIYKNGKVDKVLAPNGEVSTLYPQLEELVKDPAYVKYVGSKTAVDLYQQVHTPEFQAWYAEIPNATPEGEPMFTVGNNIPMYGDINYGRSVFDVGLFRDTDDNIYYNLDAQDGTLDDTIQQKVTSFLNKNGFSVEKADRILTAAGTDAVAQIDMLNHTVRFIDGQAQSLPEEAAHLLVEMLPDNSNLLSEMMRKITDTKTYKDVLEKYSALPEYQDASGNPRLNKIAKEAVGKVISQVIIGDETETKAKREQALSFLKRIIAFLKKTFTGKSMEFQREVSPFATAANLMLSGYTAQVPVLDEIYYNVDTAAQTDVITQLKAKADLIADEKLGTQYVLKNGKVIALRVSNLVDKVRAKVFKNSSHLDPKKLNFLSDKGTINHFYLDVLMTMDLSREKLIDAAYENLNGKLNEKRSKKFYEITEAQFKELKRGIKSLKDSILEQDPDAKILTEQLVYSQERDIAGTVDVLVVHSNGEVSIYDYKNIESLTRKGQISRQSTTLYERQISEYKRILREEYPVKGFRKSRIIPIDVKYDGDKYKDITVGSIEARKDFLKPIPVAGELTSDDNINRTLKKMIRRRDVLSQRLIVERSDELNIEYSKIDKAIKRLQLSEDYSGILLDLHSTSHYVHENIDSFTVEDAEVMNQYLSHFELYEDFISDFDSSIQDIVEELRDKGSKEQAEKLLLEIKTAVTNAISARSMIVNKIVDLYEEHFDSQLTDGGRVKSAAGAMLYGRDSYNNPLFRAYHSIISINEHRTRNDLNNVINKIREADNNLKAKYSGLSGFELMVEDGNLIKPYTKKFTEDRKYYKSLHKEAFYTIKDNPKAANKSAKADLAEAEAWAKKNLKFDETKFNEYYENYNNRISDPVSGLNSKEKVQARNNYKKLNPNNDASAWFESGFVSVNLDTLDKKYKSDKWERAQSIPEVKAYLDIYLDIMSDLREATGRSFSSVFFIPEVEKSLIDALLTGGIKPIDIFTKQFDVRQDDEVFGISDSETGEPIKSIPLLFSRPILGTLSEQEVEAIKVEAETSKSTEEELIRAKRIEKGKTMKSIDLTQSLVLFSESAFNYKYNTESVAMVQNLRHILNERQEVLQTDRLGRLVRAEGTQEFTPTKASNTATVSQFDFFVNRDFYGIRQTAKDKRFKVLNREVSAIKLTNGLMRYQSLVQLAANPVIAGANFINAKANLSFIKAEATHFTRDQFETSIKGYSSADDQAVGVISLLEIDSSGETYEKAHQASASKAKKIFSMRTMFGMHRIGDDHIKRAITVAMSKNYVIDSDGKIRSKTGVRIKDADSPSIHSLIKKDAQGNYSIDYKSAHPSMTEAQFEKEYVRFRAVINKVVSNISGSISEDQRGQAHAHIAGQLLLKFKTWMPSLIDQRFGGLRQDPLSEELDIGRFRVFVGEVIGQGILPTLANFGKEFARAASFGLYKPGYNEANAKAMYKKLKEANPDITMEYSEYIRLHQAKLNSMAIELRMFLSVLMALQLAAGLDWDDDDASFFSRFAFQNIRRSYLELSFFFNPQSGIEFFKSPIPVIKVLADLGRVLGNLTTESAEAIGFIPENTRDKSPAGYYLLKQIPGLNHVLNSIGYFDGFKQKYFIDYIVPK